MLLQLYATEFGRLPLCHKVFFGSLRVTCSSEIPPRGGAVESIYFFPFYGMKCLDLLLNCFNFYNYSILYNYRSIVLKIKRMAAMWPSGVSMEI